MKHRRAIASIRTLAPEVIRPPVLLRYAQLLLAVLALEPQLRALCDAAWAHAPAEGPLAARGRPRETGPPGR